MQLAPKQPSLDAGSSPSFCAGRQLSEVAQALLWTFLHDDPQCPSRVLLAKVASPIPIAVRIRHRNRWRATWELNRRKGRPCQAQGRMQWPVAQRWREFHVIPRLSYVGVHLFAPWLDQQDTLRRWWPSSSRR